MIGIGCVDITAREKEYVNRVLDSGLITCGPILDKFEADFAKRHGRKWGLMVNSGTDALRIAVAALREQDGWAIDDEVIVPALTFIATSNVVIQNGLVPAFADVDPATFNIDPASIERSITPRTRAIIVVHLFGLPCDMDPILDIARRRGLRVIEDSCEAMAVSYRKRPVGSFGDIACFSTYAAHVITTGVGGLAITNDAALMDLMRSYANHGRDPSFLGFRDSKTLNPSNYSTEAMRDDVIKSRFRFLRVGYSSRATQMEAALGLAQLERIDEIVFERQNNFTFLQSQLSDIPGVKLQRVPVDCEHASMMFPIVVPSVPPKRHAFMRHMEEKGIETRPFFNILGQEPYIDMFGQTESLYPNARHLSHHGFYVACHQRLSPADLWQIVDGVKGFVASAKVAA
jgi:perosamine synthetase